MKIWLLFQKKRGSCLRLVDGYIFVSCSYTTTDSQRKNKKVDKRTCCQVRTLTDTPGSVILRYWPQIWHRKMASIVCQHLITQCLWNLALSLSLPGDRHLDAKARHWLFWINKVLPLRHLNRTPDILFFMLDILFPYFTLTIATPIGDQKQNAVVCKCTMFTDDSFTKCFQDHVVISFITIKWWTSPHLCFPYFWASAFLSLLLPLFQVLGNVSLASDSESAYIYKNQWTTYYSC